MGTSTSDLRVPVVAQNRNENWELVDLVVADPVAQDNDKITIFKYIRKLPFSAHRRRGQNFPMFISCRCLVELGP